MNRWLSEVESEHTDSLNSKLNICSFFSNMEWVTVTHLGVVVETNQILRIWAELLFDPLR